VAFYKHEKFNAGGDSMKKIIYPLKNNMKLFMIKSEIDMELLGVFYCRADNVGKISKLISKLYKKWEENCDNPKVCDKDPFFDLIFPVLVDKFDAYIPDLKEIEEVYI
jgi:hypothetical protein